MPSCVLRYCTNNTNNTEKCKGITFIVTCIGLDFNATESSESRVLSRKKRFLIFPEGSSFQLVFCLTYPAIIMISDIFIWGNTAALAFELPQDPYSPFNHKADPLHRRVDSKAIYYTDEAGKIIHKQPYKRKPIVNPAFAKRSVDTDRRQIHASSTRLGLSENVEFHRISRTALYEKIEVMLQGLGGKGRECLLKTLCMYGQTNHYPQGGFLQEILRAVFTLPMNNVQDVYNDDYHVAHTASGSCDELYPDCAALSIDITRTAH